MINEIAFFCYPVSDIPRARQFYEEVLGLKLEMNFSDVWLEYDIKGATLAITSADPSRKPGVKGGVIAFEVDDFAATVAQLKTKKVQFSQDAFETPVCHLAVISDPDGNDIIVHKRK